jgi:transposase InsO family protein
VLDRNFTVSKPDQAWVAYITYVWTLEGWLYLAVILDLFSRRVVGWSMADHMRTELALGALQAALGHREPSPEVSSSTPIEAPSTTLTTTGRPCARRVSHAA